MSKLKALLRDDSGASMVEYSILIGLITAAIVGTIVTVGTWVETQWTTLDTALNGP